MSLPISEGFIGSNLKTRLSSQVVTKKTHQNDNPFKVCEAFQSRSRRFERPSKPTVPKEQDFEAYQKQKTACWKEKYQKNTPLGGFVVKVAFRWKPHGIEKYERFSQENKNCQTLRYENLIIVSPKYIEISSLAVLNIKCWWKKSILSDVKWINLNEYQNLVGFFQPWFYIQESKTGISLYSRVLDKGKLLYKKLRHSTFEKK